MRRTLHTVETSPALRRLLLDCQIWCTADCCKAAAFLISEIAVTRWLESERVDRKREIAEQITRLKTALSKNGGQVFLAARDLESTWDVSEFRDFLKPFEAAFTSAVRAHEKTGG